MFYFHNIYFIIKKQAKTDVPGKWACLFFSFKNSLEHHLWQRGMRNMGRTVQKENLPLKICLFTFLSTWPSRHPLNNLQAKEQYYWAPIIQVKKTSPHKELSRTRFPSSVHLFLITTVYKLPLAFPCFSHQNYNINLKTAIQPM